MSSPWRPRGAPGSELYLEYLGRAHGRLEIQAELDDLWLDSLITTAAACDPDFEPLTAAIGHRVIGRGIETMKRAARGPR